MENIYQTIKYTDKSCSIKSPLKAIVKGLPENREIISPFSK